MAHEIDIDEQVDLLDRKGVKRNGVFSLSRLFRLNTILLATLCFLSLILIYQLYSFSLIRFPAEKNEVLSSLSSTAPPIRRPSVADGCHSIYLDLGTNVGIQIRKLYEPEKYPKAEIHKIFDKYFVGVDRHQICSFGFEPNPKLTKYLNITEYIYRALGYPVKIFSETGVSDKDMGVAAFNDGGVADKRYWTGSLISGGNIKIGDSMVRVINFSNWFRRHILQRIDIPQLNIPPKIVMKVDIEGLDMAVISDMIRNGVYCAVDYLYVEHVTGVQTKIINEFSKQFGCNTIIEVLDDESYGISDFPFPSPFDISIEQVLKGQYDWEIIKKKKLPDPALNKRLDQPLD